MIHSMFIFSTRRKRSKNLSKSSACAVLCAALAACGGSGGVSDTDTDIAFIQAGDEVRLANLPADSIRRLGVLYFESHGQALDPSSSAWGFASFTDYGQPISQAYLESEFILGRAESCTVSVDSADEDQNISVEEIDAIDEFPNTQRVSAGTSLSVLTPLGSWPDLVLGEGMSYQFNTDTSTLGSLPEDSVVNIPGDEFPEFNNVSIPYVPALTGVSLSNTLNDATTPETRIAWDAPVNSSSNTFISIDIFEKLQDPVTDTEIKIQINCLAIDSGEFFFPLNARQTLLDYSVPVSSIRISRLGVNNEIKEDAAVLVLKVAFR